MHNPTPIDADRVRKITGSFSWLDHRLLTQGFVASMTRDELLLYFFLVLVGDRAGVSFYSYDKICTLLKIEVDTLLQARAGLLAQALLAFDGTRYQVLQLPAHATRPAHAEREPSRGGEFRALAEIFNHLRERG